MSAAETVYRHLPTWAQHMAVSAYGLRWHRLRFGPGYRRYLDELEERERQSSEAWQGWQDRRLREVLSIAADHVPYYQNSWSPSQRRAARAGRLGELPLLVKQPIRNDPEAFVRTDIKPGRRLVFHTSGSTGTPAASIWTVEELRRSMALREARSARWAKVSFELPRATFSGRLVEPDPASDGPFYRFNFVERQVYFSAFHLSAATAPQYVHALRRHRIEWMTGYAVSFYLLAKLILELELEVPPLRAVITTSEKVTETMREIIERAYRCPVYEEYSTVENVLFANDCEHGRLHVSPEAGMIEILRPDRTPCEPRESGEVVATCLLRDYQPMVRFRVGDIASWDDRPCPCGRGLPVLEEVGGRIEDVVVGPDGRQMVRFHGIFIDLPNVREGQIVQESLSRIRVRVVPAPGFGRREVSEMEARVRQRLGAEVGVEIETVERIARTAAGKYQAVVSMLDRPEVKTTGEELS